MLGLVFVAVVLVVLALASMFGRRVDLGERLAAPAASSGLRGPRLRNDHDQSAWARLIEAVEKRGLSLADSRSDAVRAKLALAGWSQPWAPRAFVLARTMLTLLLPTVALAVLLLSPDPPPPAKLYMWLTGLAAAGLYLPNIYVDHRATKRREDMLNGFPDALDLMLVCVEAGLGIDACFGRVGREIAVSHQQLSAQFLMVGLELRAGRSREDALRALAKRAGLPEITAFVTLLVQAQRLGSSIGQALKIYSIEMRESRRMRAEEKAHRLPVLISIPLVVFMLPTMLSVLMLPGAIMVMHNLLPSMETH
jgi:tight adherence protein C